MKTAFLILIALIVVTAAAGLFHLYKVSVKNKKEMAQYAGQSAEVEKDFGKTLVIYYSLSGNTKNIAEQIATKTKADLFEIKTAEPLPSGAKLHLAVRDQLKTKQYPALEKIPDISAYDTVFVGAPVWWYTIATPVLTLLKDMDFQGKKVVPFSTQGSNVGTFFDDFKAQAKNAVLLQHASFNNMGKEYDQAVEAKIADWLNKL